MEQKDNLLDVVKTLFKWRKPLIVVCALVGIGSVAISLFLPNYYQATTTFLAVSPDQSMPELVFSESPMRSAYYGNENDVDRLLTIAESNELVDFLVDTFRLYKHYNIKRDRAKAKYQVRLAFRKLYAVNKTKRDAIELSVEDKDRELAREIANKAREKIDELARKLIRANLKKTIDTYEESIKTQREQLQLLSDTLMYLRRTYGLYNIVSQTEYLTSQLTETESKLARDQGRLKTLQQQGAAIPKDTIAYLKANISGLQQAIDTLAKRIDLLNTGLPSVTTFERLYFSSSDVLTKDVDRYKKWKDTYESEIPSVIIVEEASLPAVKSRPKRSIIVLASVAIAFLFSIIAILLIDTYKDVEWKDLLKD